MSTIEIPGVIDPHVHLREPGGVHKEGFVRGTKAAAAGGVTMVLDMPNNPEPISTTSRLIEKRSMAQGRIYTDVGFHFIGTEESIPHMRPVQHLAWGLKVYMNETTGNFLEEDPDKLRRIFQGWKSPKPIIVHAENEKLEEALGLIVGTKKKLHVAHVSLASEVETIREAKEMGWPVTAEVTPHHLFMTDADTTRLGSYAEMKPPLGKQADIDALWKGLRTGVIDLVATDHAPHTKDEKDGIIAPSGVPGLETTLPLLIKAMKEGRIDYEDLVRITSTRARQIFGLPAQESKVIIDTAKKHRITASNMQSKCGWTPFEGWAIPGSIIKVEIRGETVFDGEDVIPVPRGEVISPK